MYKLVLSNKAKKQLKKLDRPIALLIAKNLKKNLDNSINPKFQCKTLVGDKKGLWRYRVGNYRVICDIRDNELIVLALEVGHRRQVYNR